MTLSTTEAEYVAECELVKELIPIREQLDSEIPTQVLIDNQSTIRIALNESGQQRTKHIDVREKWLIEQAQSMKIAIQQISGDEQAADLLTKPLHTTKLVVLHFRGGGGFFGF